MGFRQRPAMVSPITQAQKKSGSKAGLVVAGAALAAAGAGVWYCHKDMTSEELREAGENYLAKTREVSTAAYEGAKPYVTAAGEKTVEVSKDLYAKIMALLFPDGEQKTSEADPQDVPEPTQYEESVGIPSDASELVKEMGPQEETQHVVRTAVKTVPSAFDLTLEAFLRKKD